MQSILVYGPQGCGKSKNSEIIKKYFGLKKKCDGWCAHGRSRSFMHDTLLLTTPDVYKSARESLHIKAFSYDAVMKQIAGVKA